jgi:hypothetical protein
VKGAIGELLQLERLRALLASEYVQVRPHLPVYLLPRYAVGFSHKCYELLQVPVFVDCMMCAKSPLGVNHDPTSRASKCFPLATCE